MKNKNNKNGIIITVVITLVILVLLNVCTFVIPFNKIDKAAHFITYGCTEFVILVEMFLIANQLFNGDDSNQKIMSLPIIFFGLVTTIIQILATIVFYFINAFVQLPVWIVIVIECLIIGLGVIQVAKGFFFKKRNVEYCENIADTKFMDEFKTRLKTLCKINKNVCIEKPLEDLLDIALGSDPITNNKTIDSEKELLSLLQELEETFERGSEEDCKITIEKTKNALLKRNELCKLGK